MCMIISVLELPNTLFFDVVTLDLGSLKVSIVIHVLWDL